MEVSDIKISGVVKKMFKALNVQFKKKWSGYEFFGFMKSDVLEYVSVSKNQDGRAKLSNHLNSHDPLKPGLNIRAKNAGPTSSLLHQKSVVSRNDAVHQLVQYVSFGDVKSKCFWCLKHQSFFEVCLFYLVYIHTYTGRVIFGTEMMGC